MNTAEITLENPASDEIMRLLLDVARRADELMRRSGSAVGERDFWREAEAEVFASATGNETLDCIGGVANATER